MVVKIIELIFTPKVTILTPEGVTGKEATAEALVNGIKNVQLIDGGQGYTSSNPPVVVFDTPADPSGSIAKATATVDDASGQVTGINVQSSGSDMTLFHLLVLQMQQVQLLVMLKLTQKVR